ncbi:uncharacterized protein LOC135469244 [Liolophura sinensis]|uniref:uncharacterized protein LOC135469244 n=1 Tax=Liolophura sinensis TaxID=3198878 RepID=UPI003159829F
MQVFQHLFLVVVVCCRVSHAATTTASPRSQSVNPTQQSVQYLANLEDAILRMADSDNNTAVSSDEIQEFLVTTGIPEFLRNALTPDAIEVADINRNGQLERQELGTILRTMLTTVPPGRAIIQTLGFETILMINNGEIDVPKDASDVGVIILDILDTNNNSKLSMEEAHAFSQAIDIDGFFDDLGLFASILDTDGDRQLDLQELTAVYKVLQRKYDYITAEPFILYGRITTLLGEFPTYEKTPSF